MRSMLVGSRAAGFTGALIVAVLGALLIAAQTRPLRLFSTAWPPFTNEPGQPRFALDLVEAALQRIQPAHDDDDRRARGVHDHAPRWRL